MADVFKARTLEYVHAVDEPEGVSWLTGHSLQMDPVYEKFQDSGIECPDCNRWGVFPIPTEELRRAKQSVLGGVVVRKGDIYELLLNFDASTPADVDPNVIAYKLPVTDEELDKWFNEKKD